MRSAPLGASRVILVDKPEGWTSFDVVRMAKARLRTKTGHAGTLDPFATGLLLLLTTHATRVSSLLMELAKEYLITAQFGATADTGDPTGRIECTGRKAEWSEVIKAADALRGRIRQRVPMTSAVKVGGERLYRKAHRGEEVDTPEREVIVYDLSVIGFNPRLQQATLMARTGRGTYVRKLVQDLGERVGTGAYAVALRRVRVGPFGVEDALSPAQLSPDILSAMPPLSAGGNPSVLTLSAALAFLPRHNVTGVDVTRAANGNELRGTPPGRFRVESSEGLLAVYEGPAGLSRPLVVFAAPQP